jgi:hypothetical protein
VKLGQVPVKNIAMNADDQIGVPAQVARSGGVQRLHVIVLSHGHLAHT